MMSLHDDMDFTRLKRHYIQHLSMVKTTNQIAKCNSSFLVLPEIICIIKLLGLQKFIINVIDLSISPLFSN